MASGHLSVVPPYVEPRRRSVPVDVVMGIRWVCFLVLLAGFLLAIPVQHPSFSTLDNLLGDIQHGRASSISMTTDSSGSDATVRWRTEPYAWHQYQGMIGISPHIGTSFVYGPTNVMTGSVTATSATGWADSNELTRSLVTAAGVQSGHPVQIGTFSSHRVLLFYLNEAGLWGPLTVVVLLLWLSLFLGMLFTPDHPYATRWAWLWFFALGGVGPLLLLWKEPEPLRVRFWRPRDVYRWTQAPITGGTAFIYSIAWAVVVVVGGLGWTWLLARQ